MNPFLKDIFDQPSELKKVLESVTTKEIQNLKKIAEMLDHAEEIILTSMGSAYYSLMPMYYALISKGKAVSLVETSELLHTYGRIKEKALYVFMSRSGESYEIAKFTPVLMKKGVKSIGITMTPDSTMAKNVSIVLHDRSSYDSLICTKAYTTMALCGLLCVSAMGKNRLDKKLIGNLNLMLDWMDKNKELILEDIKQINFLSSVPNFYFLSRGYGMGVIKSGSLWLEEASRKIGNVSSIDNFYHGPIELSQTDTVPVFLDVYPNKRSAMIWDKICGYSQHSIYIGPRGAIKNSSVNINYPDFNINNEYTMILLAMYFQLFAYECALRNGIEPGNLETVSWVVT